MPGEIRTKRWCDPADPADGLRVLVCRYRPRALKKADETWTLWLKHLGPSQELHAAIYGKAGPVPAWDEFARRYAAEMESQAAAIADLAARVRAGESLTLLCSRACTDEARCHRSLLKTLIAARVSLHPRPPPPPME